MEGSSEKIVWMIVTLDDGVLLFFVDGKSGKEEYSHKDVRFLQQETE